MTIAKAKSNTEWRNLKSHLEDATNKKGTMESFVKVLKHGDEHINITLSHPELGEGITIILEKDGTWWIYYTNE